MSVASPNRHSLMNNITRRWEFKRNFLFHSNFAVFSPCSSMHQCSHNDTLILGCNTSVVLLLPFHLRNEFHFGLAPGLRKHHPSGYSDSCIHAQPHLSWWSFWKTSCSCICSAWLGLPGHPYSANFHTSHSWRSTSGNPRFGHDLESIITVFQQT